MISVAVLSPEFESRGQIGEYDYWPLVSLAEASLGLKDYEETKAWLRKLIRRKIITGKTVQEYTVIIDELGPKLNAFIRSTTIHEG